MSRHATPILALGLLMLAGCAQQKTEGRRPAEGTPRLLLLMVIDQGRADYFERFAPYFSDGLRDLLDQSVRFEHASHAHGITKTAPGHATIVSGVHPARHGIIGNAWYDRASEAFVKADEDGEFTPERAPTRLLTSTLGDWLKSEFPAARVFSASIKSRAAVTSGGRSADAAYWYDDDTGRFITSDYYQSASPAWLEVFNEDRLPKRWFGTSWEPLEATTAAIPELALRTVERGILRGQLPRPVGPAETVPDSGYYSDFRNETPFPDRYLGELAVALAQEERLGLDEFPDLLVLSFSSLDYIGHRYGPNSPEVLDTLLRLDATLGRILDSLDEGIGLENVVVALTSDHGAPEIPEYADGRRFWIEERSCLQQAERALDAELGDADWLEADLVLDRDVLGSRGLELADVVSRLATEISNCPGIEAVWTAQTIAKEAPTNPMADLYRHSFRADQSPDLVLQNEAGSVMTHNETNHGSPYDYDRRVPWLLRLPAATPLAVSEAVLTIDIAPTLAEILGIDAPLGLDGRSRLATVTASQPQLATLQEDRTP